MKLQEFGTLTDLLASQAALQTDRVAFIFAEKPWTFGRMWEGINRFAGFLLKQGMNRGDRVVLALPNSPGFFTAFYGVQRAGGIPVPFYPDSGPERILTIARLCEAGAIVTPSPEHSQRICSRTHGRNDKISFYSVSERADLSGPYDFPTISPEDTALIQYTSGSTGNPKGVILSHANLVTNINQIVEGMELTQKDRFVSWLPVNHDLGLILKTMVPFFLGADLHLLPTRLINLRHWVETIHKNRATIIAAPDFAYRLLLAYIKNPLIYDLSSLRIALNAAEPVRAKTVGDFERSFRLKHVMKPAYGLAEATVGVSLWASDEQIKVDERGFVSIGTPLPNIKMGILSKGKLAEPGQTGEILVKSPSNTRGYFKNQKESSRLFWRGDYIHTGDMGYYDQSGDFFIIGRKKNIIIQSGQNISPQEIEETVDTLPFVRNSAAVGIDRGRTEGEQAFIFVEIRVKKSTGEEELDKISVDIVQRFYDRFGFRPGRIYLVKPRTISLTHNGKKQYSLLKKQYRDGTLRKKNLILHPAY